MAANFWTSSHCEQWIFDKHELASMRVDDMQFFTEEEYQKLMIFWANLIQQIATDCVQQVSVPKTRMQVIATAIVYFKRFYLRRSFKDVDPFLMACASIHLASKVEEHGQMSMSKMVSIIPNVLKKYPNVSYDGSAKNASVYDAEFILVETMDCCLIVYHPYRALGQLIADIGKDPSLKDPKEQKELAELEAQAWKVVNDSLRTDCSLLYAPHIIACGCIIVGAELMSNEKFVKNWLPEIAIDLDKVMEVVRIMVNMYKIWRDFDEREQVKPLIDKLPKIQSSPNGQQGTFKKLV